MTKPDATGALARKKVRKKTKQNDDVAGPDCETHCTGIRRFRKVAEVWFRLGRFGRQLALRLGRKRADLGEILWARVLPSPSAPRTTGRADREEDLLPLHAVIDAEHGEAGGIEARRH